MKFKATFIEELVPIAEYLIQEKNKPIVLLIGQLGAGKTTLVKSIMELLGDSNQVSSPTFSLINEYLDDKQETVYHMDLYRIETIEEALNIGIEEYLDSGRFCFIEWPEIIDPILGDNIQIVTLELKEDGSRMISITR